MPRLLALVGALYIAFVSSESIPFDDIGDDQMSLLQLRANSSESEHSSSGYWKNGGCRADIGADVVSCGWESDMHMRGRFPATMKNPDWMEVGLRAGAYTTDDSVSMQIFQCPWNGGAMASTAGVALKFGTHVFEFLREPNCREEVYVKLDGELLDIDSLPLVLEDGLFVEKSSHREVCIDSPDGKSSAAVRYKMNWKNCGNMMDQAWYDMSLKIPKSVAVTGDDSACGMEAREPPNQLFNVRKIDFDVEETLFSHESHKHLCEKCNWGGRGPCEMPPPTPPAPPSQQQCEDAGCSYDGAKELCSSLKSHEAAFESCLIDICASCGDGIDPAIIAAAAIENEEMIEPGPCCVDASSSCGLPSDTCTGSVKMNLFNQVSNNLGGVGPDAGAEEMRFSNAAAVKGKVLDLVVKQTGGDYKAGKPSNNGLSKNKAFGVVNLKSKSSVDLEFSFEDSESGEKVTLDGVSITFLDVDEGKKGKSRTTLTACSADNAVVTTSTELTLETLAGCYAVSSSVHGTAADNPTSAGALTATQAARTVTFVFTGKESATIKYAISKGYGARNVFFVVEPTIPCLDGYDADLPCNVAAPAPPPE